MEGLSCCGTNCRECGFYGGMCGGCEESEGKVFHCEPGKACAIYDCVRNGKRYSDCSACGELPCAIWKNTRDPRYSDEEFENSIKERIASLRRGGTL